jgi:proline dehydrogenase
MIPPVANNFVAGETPAQALEHARQLNGRSVGAILNLLGEHYDERDPADQDTAAYVSLVEDIGATDLRACVSVKPSQIGLDVGEPVFRENADRIAAAAADAGVFLWLDMEDHTTVDATLDVYEDLTTTHDGGVGVCLQANLRRTPEDIERLAALPGKVRLVKGAYDPPTEVSFDGKARVNEAYRDCLEQLFDSFEDGVAVGSHDPEMVDLARRLHAEYGTPYEIQMLMGVRESAQTELATDAEVWQYVPYGTKWLSYFYRRVAERRENLTFALRALVGG